MKNVEIKKIITVEELEEISLDGNTFAFDTETVSLHGDILALSMYDGKTAYYFRIRQDDEDESLFSLEKAFLSKEEIFPKINKFFEEENKIKIGHNIKYDMKVLAKCGVNVKGSLIDTLVWAWLLNENDENKEMSLKKLAKEILGENDVIAFDDIAKYDKSTKSKTLKGIDEEILAKYSVQDSILAYNLAKALFDQINKEGLFEHYYNIEMPMIYCLFHMEQNGVYVDKDNLEKCRKLFEEKKKEAEDKCISLCGKPINLNSPDQIANIFKEKGLDTKIRTTKMSKMSTSSSALEHLKHPLAKQILEYRKYEKLLNTFILPIYNYMNEKGRVSCDYNLTGTVTGRLSSSNPNLQNIPADKQVRAIFAAPEGKILLKCDYSQIELRVLAHFSQDERLLGAYSEGKDVHKETASLIFKVPIDEVTDEQRQVAKTMNFGIIYGMSSLALSQNTGMTEKEAKEFLDRYFKVYYGVERFIRRTKREAEKNLFVTTISGRKRRLSNITNENQAVKNYALRQAVNAVIQGSAADIVKKAMVDIDNSNLNCKMVMQIHDELVFEVEESKADWYATRIRNIMESPYKEVLTVPLVVDIKKGKHWS